MHLCFDCPFNLKSSSRLNSPVRRLQRKHTPKHTSSGRKTLGLIKTTHLHIVVSGCVLKHERLLVFNLLMTSQNPKLMCLIINPVHSAVQYYTQRWWSIIFFACKNQLVTVKSAILETKTNSIYLKKKLWFSTPWPYRVSTNGCRWLEKPANSVSQTLLFALKLSLSDVHWAECLEKWETSRSVLAACSLCSRTNLDSHA